MLKTLLPLLLMTTGLSAEIAPQNCGLYAYKAVITRVIDGDTVVANIDLGFHTWIHDEHLRLFGLDAPSRKTTAGKAVTIALRERLEGKAIYICTRKMKLSDREARGSFGRYLVEIYDGHGSVNQWLLDDGMAVPFQQ